MLVKGDSCLSPGSVIVGIDCCCVEERLVADRDDPWLSSFDSLDRYDIDYGR